MLFKKEKKQEAPRPERIKKLPDAELRAWMNTCLMELGASYDMWAYHDGDAQEMTKILELVNNLWAELQSR